MKVWIRFGSACQNVEERALSDWVIVEADSDNFRFMVFSSWKIEAHLEDGMLNGRIFYKELPIPHVIVEAVKHGSCRTDLNGSFELQIKEEGPSEIYLNITLPEPICEALKEFLASKEYEDFRSEIAKLWWERPLMLSLIFMEEYGREPPPERRELRELYERKKELEERIRERWIEHVKSFKPKEDAITLWLKMMAKALAHMAEKAKKSEDSG